MQTPRILAFAGSTRRESFNRRAIRVAAGAVREAGGEVTLIELADYPMPIMDQDLEEESGLPEHAVRLKDLFMAHDALLISCPEYNSSITPLLKNTIDWVSRRREGEAALAAFSGKVAGLIAASPGALGGLRCLREVRSILGSIGVVVIPEQAAIAQAHTRFEGESLTDEGMRQRIESVARSLVRTTGRLKDG